MRCVVRWANMEALLGGKEEIRSNHAGEVTQGDERGAMRQSEGKGGVPVVKVVMAVAVARVVQSAMRRANVPFGRMTGGGCRVVHSAGRQRMWRQLQHRSRRCLVSLVSPP
jgi:hypothetical protein